MEEQRTRYRGYELLDQQTVWDPHTREIVLKRLGPFEQFQYLKDDEARTIRSIVSHLIYEQRPEILDFIVHHFDQSLAAQIGENQRKLKTPKEPDLIHWGLAALNKLSQQLYHQNLFALLPEQQFGLIAALQTGNAPELPDWDRVPQKELFKKLLELTVSAYYSHPTIWSEIGYGGPAYPRGYIRTELGLSDPWEAKLDE